MATEIWVNIGLGNGLVPGHQAINWTNVDLSSAKTFGIHLWAVSQEMLKISIWIWKLLI